MYFIDTPTLQVVAFDFDADRGELSNGRTIITFPQGIGRPDGMTIDVEGMLWIAHWEGWRVSRWNPHEGRLLDEVRLPVHAFLGRVWRPESGSAVHHRPRVSAYRKKISANSLTPVDCSLSNPVCADCRPMSMPGSAG